MITGEQVKKSVSDSGERFIPLRECSICGGSDSAIIEENDGRRYDGRIYFDSSCNCQSFTAGLQQHIRKVLTNPKP